jgi:hypothetical protein
MKRHVQAPTCHDISARARLAASWTTAHNATKYRQALRVTILYKKFHRNNFKLYCLNSYLKNIFRQYQNQRPHQVSQSSGEQFSVVFGMSRFRNTSKSDMLNIGSIIVLCFATQMLKYCLKLDHGPFLPRIYNPFSLNPLQFDAVWQ